MALAGNAFCEPAHKDTGYLCHEGFTVIKYSLDLSKWKNQEIFGILFSVTNLLRHGYLARLILAKPEGSIVFNDYWQLNNLAGKFFKALDKDGFINLEFNSIPPCYDEGYLDKAIHHIKITLMRH